MEGSGSHQITLLEEPSETRVVVSGVLGFQAAADVRDVLILAARRSSLVVLDLRRTFGYDFTTAALVRDARAGAGGLPPARVLLGPIGNILLDTVAGAGG